MFARLLAQFNWRSYGFRSPFEYGFRSSIPVIQDCLDHFLFLQALAFCVRDQFTKVLRTEAPLNTKAGFQRFG